MVPVDIFENFRFRTVSRRRDERAPCDDVCWRVDRGGRREYMRKKIAIQIRHSLAGAGRRIGTENTRRRRVFGYVTVHVGIEFFPCEFDATEHDFPVGGVV